MKRTTAVAEAGFGAQRLKRPLGRGDPEAAAAESGRGGEAAGRAGAGRSGNPIRARGSEVTGPARGGGLQVGGSTTVAQKRRR